MVAGLASTRSILPVVLGFTLGAAVAVPAKLNRPPAAVAVASAADSSCIAFLNVLGTSPGGFAIVDNGLVRDTIVTPNPQLQRNLEYRRGRACVDSVDNKGRDSAQSALRGDYSRLVMIHAMIPEYHDEQRLSDGSGGLGPRAHVYASPNLDDFEWPWQVGEHQGSGVLVAHVFGFLAGLSERGKVAASEPHQRDEIELLVGIERAERSLEFLLHGILGLLLEHIDPAVI